LAHEAVQGLSAGLNSAVLGSSAMPDFPLIDTHVHLWEPGRLNYAWLAGVPALNRPHALAEFRRDCGGVAVVKWVFVQCECVPAQSQAEAEWVSGLAQRDPRLGGIVAQAPLEIGAAVAPALARLAALPLVKGVRRLLQAEADDAFCLRPDFVRGVQLLPQFGLSFDLCIFHRQLANVIQLVRRCPEVSFVLDHIGKPDIKAGRLDPWRTELRELAALPNVTCKLSGLVTEADWAAWTPADLQPYLDHVLACFGADRVMFGGDWPVSTQATDYPRWVATLDAALGGCSRDERHRIYVRNAERVYRV
jgi:L-fuconolactonase